MSLRILENDFIKKKHCKNFPIKHLFKILLICLLHLHTIKSDLPVHCMQADVIGFWTLKISNKKFTPSLQNEMETTCGHGLPNKVVDLLDDSDLKIANYLEKKILLAKDYKIYEDNQQVGTWSFVYDQSFILYYKNSILTAPFKYYKKPGASDEDSESNCGKTFLGWYIPDKNNLRSNWSCFYGIKQDNQAKVEIENKFNFLQIEISMQNKNNKKNELEEYIKSNIEQGHVKKNNILGNLNDNNNEITEINNNKDKIKVNNNNENLSSLSFAQKNENENMENLIKYEQLSKIVDKLNSLDLGWKADILPQYVGLSFAEMKHNLGLNKGKYSKKGLLSESISFIQLANKNQNSFLFFPENKNVENDKVEQFLKSVEDKLSLISLKSQENAESKEALLEKKNANKDLTANNSFEENKSNSKLKQKSKNRNQILSSLKNNQKNLFPPSNNHYQNNFDYFILEKGPRASIIPENINSISSLDKNNDRDKDSYEVFDYKEVTKYLNKDISEIDEKKLSKNWDWRNVGGVSFVPPVKSQGSCGSCYVFSTMTSLEARLRIQTNNNDQTLFSRQFPLSCNFYSEGCNGGYPVLVAKFLNEFEAVPESCFEYTETNDKCSNVCDYSKLKKKYTVSQWGYLGGAYGKTSEADIMKELRARGPLPGNILVHWSFHYYKNGIFSTQNLKRNANEISKKTMNDLGRTWAKVEHSITIVGYGEQDGVKYWIGMNTWGDQWGENGFFKIARGNNESEIESMGDFMNIKVEDRY